MRGEVYASKEDDRSYLEEKVDCNPVGLVYLRGLNGRLTMEEVSEIISNQWSVNGVSCTGVFKYNAQD